MLKEKVTNTSTHATVNFEVLCMNMNPAKACMKGAVKSPSLKSPTSHSDSSQSILNYYCLIEYVRTFYKCSFIEEETHNLNMFTAIVALFEFEFNRDTQFKFLASTVLGNKN